MRRKITILLLMLSQLLTSSGFAQTVQVTCADALSITKQRFEGQDVDYYLVPDSVYWKIFVDAMPQANWMHECYLVTIPKTTSDIPEQIVPEIEERRRPPNIDMQDLDVKRRYDPNAYKKPIVKKNNNRISLKRANQTSALILSGGANKRMNYQRYWNDCSFIY